MKRQPRGQPKLVRSKPRGLTPVQASSAKNARFSAAGEDMAEPVCGRGTKSGQPPAARVPTVSPKGTVMRTGAVRRREPKRHGGAALNIVEGFS